MNKNKFINIGTVKVSKKKNPDDENELPRFYLQLQQQKLKDGKPYGEQVFPITLANGKVLNDGDILAMFAKRPKLQQAVEDGKMDQDTADFLSSFLKYDVCVVESSENQELDKSEGPNF